MLLVPLDLHLVSPDNGYKFGAFEKVPCVFASKKDRAVALVVVDIGIAAVDGPVVVLNWVRPHQIAQ
jgi:hypothetical protein